MKEEFLGLDDVNRMAFTVIVKIMRGKRINSVKRSEGMMPPVRDFEKAGAQFSHKKFGLQVHGRSETNIDHIDVSEHGSIRDELIHVREIPMICRSGTHISSMRQICPSSKFVAETCRMKFADMNKVVHDLGSGFRTMERLLHRE